MKIIASSILSAVIVSMLSLGISSGIIFAESIQDGLTDLENRLDVPTDGDVRTSIEDVINAALNYVTLIGVVVIIIAGFVLMFGAGSDESIQKAKKIIIYTLIGIFVIYFSRVIVGLITNVATDSSTSINN